MEEITWEFNNRGTYSWVIKPVITTNVYPI